MLITVDRDTHELVLTLAEDSEPYRNELMHLLLEEFAFEPQSRDVIIRMNQFAMDWLADKGIILSEDNKHGE